MLAACLVRFERPYPGVCARSLGLGCWLRIRLQKGTKKPLQARREGGGYGALVRINEPSSLFRFRRTLSGVMSDDFYAGNMNSVIVVGVSSRHLVLVRGHFMTQSRSWYPGVTTEVVTG